MDNYVSIFIESMWVASVIPLSHEPTFYAMLSFGGFNMPAAAAVAVTGATIGQMFNWFIGSRLYNSRLRRHFYISDEWYAKVKKIFNTYLIFTLLFSWAPLVKMVLVLAGFLETRWQVVLPLVLLGQIFNYVWPLM